MKKRSHHEFSSFGGVVPTEFCFAECSSWCSYAQNPVCLLCFPGCESLDREGPGSCEVPALLEQAMHTET